MLVQLPTHSLSNTAMFLLYRVNRARMAMRMRSAPVGNNDVLHMVCGTVGLMCGD